jgi:hypothetical protein
MFDFFGEHLPITQDFNMMPALNLPDSDQP